MPQVGDWGWVNNEFSPISTVNSATMNACWLFAQCSQLVRAVILIADQNSPAFHSLVRRTILKGNNMVS